MKFAISFLCALFYSSNTKNVREKIDLSTIRDQAQFISMFPNIMKSKKTRNNLIKL